MPNGETAQATGSVNRGTANRIAFQTGQIGSSRRKHLGDPSFVEGTNTRVQTGKPKGYSTERHMKGIRAGLKEAGLYNPRLHSAKQVATTHRNFVNAGKRSKKGRKKKKAS